jgi:cytidyltransferase-like protein
MRSIICFLFFSASLKAAVLDENFDLTTLQGKKVGYYIGSFDPIHLGHQEVVEKSLQYVDFVLIYPAPGGDTFKNRTPWPLRLKMIASVYQANPKVLFTYWTPKELQDKFPREIEVIGIIGSDVVNENLMGPDAVLSEKYNKVFMRGLPLPEKHLENTIGALMALKANSFIVAKRDSTELSENINDRPVVAFFQSQEISSTMVRNAIREKREFEQWLAFPIQALIKQERLYGFPLKFNPALQKELLEMQERDQTARLNGSEVSEIDKQHGERLKEIVDQFGWPGVSLAGLEGAFAMWLLVQHQDENLEFQKKCLALLKEAVNACESPFCHYAYLLDRVNVNEKRPSYP